MSDKRSSSAEIHYAVVNDKGLVRGNNEDNFYLNGSFMHHGHLDDGAKIADSCKEMVQLYAVCDGMGGIDAGEDASYRAVSMLDQKKDIFPGMADPSILREQLREISDAVYDEAAGRRQKSGTTIAMVIIRGNYATIANVGDSRVYRFRERKLTQVSLDHSKVQRMIAMGLLTPEQAKTDPNRHVISQYLGMPKDIRVSPHIENNVELQKGDVYLLCSDGLTDMVEDLQIEAILCAKSKPEEAAKVLLETALENGGRDNTTVMLLKVASPAKHGAGKQRRKIGPAAILSILQVIAAGAFLTTAVDLIYMLVR